MSQPYAALVEPRSVKPVFHRIACPAQLDRVPAVMERLLLMPETVRLRRRPAEP